MSNKSSLVEAVIWHCQENLNEDVMKTPECVKVQIDLEQLRKRLLALMTPEQARAAGTVLNDLNDITTQPLAIAEEKGFREGFKAALRLLKELDRWAAQ